MVATRAGVPWEERAAAFRVLSYKGPLLAIARECEWVVAAKVMAVTT